MSSAKTRANRTNGQKSRGPRTAQGKSRSGRNALKHGLARHYHPLFAQQTKKIAEALCGQEENLSLLEKAIAVAECELLWSRICAERVGVIERLFEPTAFANAKGDKRLTSGQMMYKELTRASDKSDELEPRAFNQKREDLGQEPLCNPDDPIWKFELLKDRDTYGAVKEATRDLQLIRRYERRAWSARKRAIREYIATKALLNSK